MPEQSPGRRFSVIATKAVTHGSPTVEANHPGIAAKSTQAAPAVPNLANAAAAQQIAVGEEFVIMLDGSHPIATALLPAGYAVGSQLYIRPADNTLHLAGAIAAGDVKLGVIDDIDTTRAIAHVNFNLRGTF